jgi:hypothetical protein
MSLGTYQNNHISTMKNSRLILQTYRTRSRPNKYDSKSLWIGVFLMCLNVYFVMLLSPMQGNSQDPHA